MTLKQFLNVAKQEEESVDCGDVGFFAADILTSSAAAAAGGGGGASGTVTPIIDDGLLHGQVIKHFLSDKPVQKRLWSIRCEILMKSFKAAATSVLTGGYGAQ